MELWRFPPAALLCGADLMEPAVSKPMWTLKQIVDGHLSNGWDEGPWGQNVSYSVLQQGQNWDSNSLPMEGGTLTPFNAEQTVKASEAFELWDDLIAIDLNPVASQSANIRMFGAVGGYGGTATKTSDNGISTLGTAASVRIDIEDHDGSDVDYGSKEFHSYLHEIGHSLGLGHPGDYNASAEYQDKGGAEYAQDTGQYSVMSYFAAEEFGTANHKTEYGRVFASTPMLHDIATIQHLYGADLTTRTNDTVYGFNNTSGREVFDFSKNDMPVAAIWDAGGIDTLDVSGFGTTPQYISLEPGTYSSIGVSIATGTRLTQNLALAEAVDSQGHIRGVDVGFDEKSIVNYIENAIGSAGDDEITGNAAANRLVGNDGNDVLFGKAGDDIIEGGDGKDHLDGGDGADFMAGGADNDSYIVDDVGDIVSERAWFGNNNFGGYLDAGGIDEVRTTLQSYTLPSGVENLSTISYLSGPTWNFEGTGNALDNVIFGGGGFDRLSGKAGDDTLYGGAHTDTAVFVGNSWEYSLTSGDGWVKVADSNRHGRDGIDTLYDIEQLEFANGTYVIMGDHLVKKSELDRVDERQDIKPDFDGVLGLDHTWNDRVHPGDDRGEPFVAFLDKVRDWITEVLPGVGDRNDPIFDALSALAEASTKTAQQKSDGMDAVVFDAASVLVDTSLEFVVPVAALQEAPQEDFVGRMGLDEAREIVLPLEAAPVDTGTSSSAGAIGRIDSWSAAAVERDSSASAWFSDSAWSSPTSSWYETTSYVQAAVANDSYASATMSHWSYDF